MEVQGNFCRACLQKFEESGELLQYTEKSRRQFVYSTGLQVKRNDVIPFQLCKDCFINMKMSCRFRKLCRSSDKKLKNYNALKEVGEHMDLGSFLKNTDESFRFPFMNGYSTPMYNKSKDDDNESTTTSIRNFMTDMLQPEDLADTEARIVREVIEEEADILDDSLDSHWLQDDMSIDTDFQLDFSLNSPFATPRPQNNDRLATTPPKLTEEMHYTTISKKLVNIEAENNREEIQDAIDKNLAAVLKVQKDDFLVKVELNGEYNDELVPDTIDKNLAAALKVQKDEILLEELIVSPADFRTDTPTLTNILFGGKVFDVDKYPNLNSGKDDFCQINNVGNNIENDVADKNSQSCQLLPKVECIEKPQNVEADSETIPDSFESNPLKLNFYVENEQLNKTKSDIEDSESEEEYVTHYTIESLEELLTNSRNINKKFKCPLCDFKCGTYRMITSHVSKKHGMKMVKPKTKYICPECGATFNDHSNYVRHVKIHLRPAHLTEPSQCDICKRWFKNKRKIETHMMRHNIMHGRKRATVKRKTYLCTICGSTQLGKSNFNVHLRRHTSDFTMHCVECGKGFFRSIDLKRHMTKHTQEKSQKCEICQKTYGTADQLMQHIRIKHTDELPFQCDYCLQRFAKNSAIRFHLRNNKHCLKLRNESEVNNGNSEEDST